MNVAEMDRHTDSYSMGARESPIVGTRASTIRYGLDRLGKACGRARKWSTDRDVDVDESGVGAIKAGLGRASEADEIEASENVVG